MDEYITMFIERRKKKKEKKKKCVQIAERGIAHTLHPECNALEPIAFFGLRFQKSGMCVLREKSHTGGEWKKKKKKEAEIPLKELKHKRAERFTAMRIKVK